MDSRHKKRILLVQNLYAFSFLKKGVSLPHNEDITKHIIESLPSIDIQIAQYATKFPIDKIAKIDLAILRLALYELFFEKKEPQKVIINEAIELAKELGGEKSYVFINGVLGKLVKQ